ncbi:MAG: FAD-dependent monooxygenase [Naasia sp.]
MTRAGSRVDADVLVVGGGPVGLVSAIRSRLAGLDTVLLEPRTGVLDKACGEGLMPRALASLAEIGVDPPGMPIAGFRYLDAQHSAEHRLQHPGRGVRRTALHAALSARADELGVRRVAGKVARIVQLGDTVEAGGVSASWMLACDGLHSTVSTRLGLDVPPRRGIRRYGLRRHFAIEPWTDLVEVHWSADAEAYVTPVSESEIGVSVLAARGQGFDAAVAGMPVLAERLAGAEPSGTLRGAGPFGHRTSRRVAGRVLLVGDSSGYVDALTGEGLRVGFAQAEAAVAAIVAGVPERYERDWERATGEVRRLTSLLVAAAVSPLRPAIVPAAARLPRVFSAAVDRIAG